MAKEAGRKKSRISVLLNYVMIGAVLLASFLFVPEAYRPEGLNTENTVGIEHYDAYFLELDGKYKLYTNGEHILTFSYIPEEMKEIPVIEED